MLIFFDFDGTLSAPRFPNPDSGGPEYIYGFTAESWKNYYEEMGEKTFSCCLPVGPVRRYALKKKEEGHRLFVLTRTASNSEDAGKKAFLEKWYPGVFEEYISVRHDSEKIPVILRKAEENGMTSDQCELVEDTYMLVLQALSSDMRGVHVSNIVAEEEMAQTRKESGTEG